MAERDTFLLFVRPLNKAGFRYVVTWSNQQVTAPRDCNPVRTARGNGARKRAERIRSATAKRCRDRARQTNIPPHNRSSGLEQRARRLPRSRARSERAGTAGTPPCSRLSTQAELAMPPYSCNDAQIGSARRNRA